MCDSKCISSNLTCDDVRNCEDGRDEGEVCDSSRLMAPLGHVTVSAGLVIGVLLALIVLVIITAYVAVVLYRRYSIRRHHDPDTMRMTEECDEDSPSVPDTLLSGSGTTYGTNKSNGKGAAVFEVSGPNVYI